MKVDRALFCLVLCAAGCLPDDTRPPPGKATVTVTAHDASSDLETLDGWRVAFDDLLLGIGQVEFGGDACNAYTESDYLRLLDLRIPDPQRLCTAYALGSCELAFSLQSPARDTVLGEGVGPSALLLMREEASDAFAERAGTVLYAAGRGVRGDREVTFAWAFRLGIEFPSCGVVDFRSDEEIHVQLFVQSSVLFQTGLDPLAAELSFEQYAMADFDSDGDVTLDELDRVPLDQSEGEPFQSLAERLYLGLVPEMVRGQGGPCAPHFLEGD